MTSSPLTSSPSPSLPEPRDQPLRGATFGQAIDRFYRRWSTFSGRASRSEYWWVGLYYGLVVGGLWLAATVTGAWSVDAYGVPAEPSSIGVVLAVLMVLFVLVGTVPTLALNARRLHDANLSGWFQLVCFVPTIGGVIMSVLALLPSSDEGERFDA